MTERTPNSCLFYKNNINIDSFVKIPVLSGFWLIICVLTGYRLITLRYYAYRTRESWNSVNCELLERTQVLLIAKMKINEKNLCVFATSPPYDKEGFLYKRGEVNKSFQKRYFVLKGNLLFYFEKKGDKEPLGLIIVEGCTIGEMTHLLI